MTTSPRKVSLRFLREGPTHNHLLSPLTPYLATVGRNDAATVRMPYEHRRLLRDLAALRYGATPSRAPDLSRIPAPDRRLIADDVSAIFESIPGLNAEIGSAQVCHPRLVHLELNFSAAELSMLPFELATSPRGFPGEGLPLSVQVSTPIVITRTVPSAPGRDCRWNLPPRILFAWASPPGMRPVPHEAHLAALVKALQPWTGPLHELPGSDADRAAQLAKYLVVLPQATRRQIEQQCRDKPFTHVHLLAHGAVVADGTEPQYALALHGERGAGTELVNAERLQAALRVPLARIDDGKSLSHPIVVTLATCDSGNQSQVMTPGMSLAHAIHAAGVPLVVGSLFPLTFGGSVVLAETLYCGLLRGRDPRWVLYDVRHRLFRRDEGTHDWASMVAYASFADDIEDQATDVQYLAACATIDAHIKVANGLVKLLAGDPAGRPPVLAQIDKKDQAIRDAEAELPDQSTYLIEGHGMRASAEKKRARVLFDAATVLPTEAAAPNATAGGDSDPPSRDDTRGKLLERSVEALRSAQHIYHGTAQIPPWAVQRPVLGREKLPTLHWVLTQSLCLQFVLTRSIDLIEWHAAVSNAQMMLNGSAALHAASADLGDPGDPIWAHGSLMELYLLAHGMLMKKQEEASSWPAQSDDKARMHFKRFVAAARESPVTFFLSSTRAQLERYTKWWFTKEFVQSCGVVQPDDEGAAVAKLATELAAQLGS